jgi:hypothetical protein
MKFEPGIYDIDFNPNFDPSHLKLINGPRDLNGGKAPSTIGVTNKGNFRGAAGITTIGLITDAADGVRQIWIGSQMIDIRNQLNFTKTTILQNIEDAKDNGIIPSDLSKEDTSHLVNLLLSGESEGSSQKHKDMYNEIVNKVIIPSTLIKVDTSSPQSDNTATSTNRLIKNEKLENSSSGSNKSK